MRFRVLRGALILACALCILQQSVGAQSYDLVIRNGLVVDGTGRLPRRADVAIKNGRIVLVGIAEGRSESTVDATGLMVCPGFIDVHTHAEEIEQHPLAENFARMGVTTVILGNCGFSVENVGALFSRLGTNPPSVNVGTLVGQGSNHSAVMGKSFMRPPNERELDEMRRRVREGMKAGALGVSTGLIYLPGTFTKTEELVELAKVAARYGGIYASHMRSEDEDIFNALDELIRIAKEAGIPAHVSHIKVSGKPTWGQAGKVLEKLRAARAQGLEITQDQYVYTASSTGIQQLVPDEFRAEDAFALASTDSERREAMVAKMKDRLKERLEENYAFAVIARYAKEPTLDGLNIVDAARKHFGSATLDDQIKLILEIRAHGGAQGVFHSMKEEDLREFLADPRTMFASDSGVRVYNEGVPHPRGYGNNARVLARYVRDLKLLTFEEAIRRMTSLPARTFKLHGRGELSSGFAADVLVLDPAAVQDHATFSAPHHYATGFRQVIVNGVVVVDDDTHTQARPGQVLKRNRGR